ncbi:similar to PLCeta2 [Ectocarpus siliculosus]|uniref:Similar to PLCeta2 n=1 Tax=Ectocarpus siliculosus TaxID=2880 RepID=D8LCM3_ECTSI|nr:similar to PLCeta2 [Ectocarpus siliculosus]|eukprot:CBN79536.1 similar to PLCeta2 [Ectocarpus siliculosus]
MDELFEEWDKDGNNLITREELTRGLNKLGVYLSATQTRELFRLADPDHSKSIGPAEFRAFLSDLQTLADEPELLSRQVTLRLQRRAIAEEREHPRVDDCGLLAACAAADGGGGGGGGGVARRVGETRRAASMSSVV